MAVVDWTGRATVKLFTLLDHMHLLRRSFPHGTRSINKIFLELKGLITRAFDQATTLQNKETGGEKVLRLPAMSSQ